MNPNFWQPSANIENLRQRAKIFQEIRNFFAARNILEIETPLLCRTVNSDPYIQAFTCESGIVFNHQKFYLQTSPEFAMKRLLAAGSGAIYQICKAFRQDECARLHNPEFTILEWYRPGFDHYQLMNEIAELIQIILKVKQIARITYKDLFLRYVGLNPFTASLNEIQNCAKNIDLNQQDFSRDTWLNIIMTHMIEPQLKDQIIFVYDYPASQAALAKIRKGEESVAERFELYAYGIELANGFHELIDANEQRQRFIQDNQIRKQQQLPEIPIDDYLIAALQAGMPESAGVALGLDRLIMLALNQDCLANILSFNAEKI